MCLMFGLSPPSQTTHMQKHLLPKVCCLPLRTNVLQACGVRLGYVMYVCVAYGLPYILAMKPSVLESTRVLRTSARRDISFKPFSGQKPEASACREYLRACLPMAFLICKATRRLHSKPHIELPKIRKEATYEKEKCES